MSDEIDRAQEREQLDRELALDAQRKRQAIASRTECVECGEVVSALRQQLGADRCIECQQQFERLGR